MLSRWTLLNAATCRPCGVVTMQWLAGATRRAITIASVVPLVSQGQSESIFHLVGVKARGCSLRCLQIHFLVFLFRPAGRQVARGNCVAFCCRTDVHLHQTDVDAWPAGRSPG